MPPPSTPAPKFLFKRPVSTQQLPQTPFSSTQLFVTPRVAGSQSGNRPDALFTQTHGRPRYRDDIESSPVSSPRGSPDRRHGVNESIEDVEDGAQESIIYRSDASEEIEIVEDSQELRSPARKRRRISISPDLGTSPQVIPSSPIPDSFVPESPVLEPQMRGEDDDVPTYDNSIVGEAEDEEGMPGSPSSGSSLDLTQRERRVLPSVPRFKVRSPKRDSSAEALEKARQPTFRPPPRFILPEVEARVLDGLPPAFSPQRKGAKFVPGGLAAELQGWLSHMKGSTGEGPILRIRVEEVRLGGTMYLIRGRKLPRSEEVGGAEVKIMLAGEGQLTGLGTRAPLTEGCVVNVGEPAWGIDIASGGEGRWIVGCDWKVEV